MRHLTQEIFSGQPDSVKYAAIDKSGDVLGFERDPIGQHDIHGWLVAPSFNPVVVIDDSEGFDTTAWQHSIIRRIVTNDNEIYR